MTTITIPVPDGGTCKGCEYKSHSYYEHGYQSYEEYDYCNVFQCKIKGMTKCVACKVLAKRSDT